jgi:hypothetical protein
MVVMVLGTNYMAAGSIINPFGVDGLPPRRARKEA